MSESNIRTQIKTILSGVSNIGVIFDYGKSVKTESLVKSNFISNSILHVWMITLESVNENRIIIGQNNGIGFSIIYDYTIEGWYALNDINESEKDLMLIVESISTAFRSNLTLNNSCYRHYYITVSDIMQTMFCGILCNKVNLILQVEERT